MFILALILAVFTGIHLIALKKLSHQIVFRIKYARLIVEIIITFGMYFWLNAQIAAARADEDAASTAQYCVSDDIL